MDTKTIALFAVFIAAVVIAGCTADPPPATTVTPTTSPAVTEVTTAQAD